MKPLIERITRGSVTFRDGHNPSIFTSDHRWLLHTHNGAMDLIGPPCMEETGANPEPVLPPGLPPLPPGTRYAGQLKDNEGFVSGWCCYADPRDEWVFYDEWVGAKPSPNTLTAQLHVATPITP